MNERTRLFVAMGLAAVILFGWVPLLRTVEHATGWALLPKEPPPATQPATQESAAPTTPALTTAPSQIPGSVLLPATTQTGILPITATPTTRPADVLIGSAAAKDKQFAMQVRVSPVGGGLSGVTLNDFKERVDSSDPFEFEDPYNDATLALSTRSVTIDGVAVPAGLWRIDSTTANSATVSLDLNDTTGPVLTLVKTFEVLPRDEGGAHGPLGYDTKFTYSFINRTARQLVVSSALNGPTFPPSEQPRGGDRQVIAGYQGKNVVVIRHDPLEGFSAGASATKDYTVYENQPLLWFGAGGNYFNGIVRPTGEQWVKSATAKALNPDADAHLRQVVLDVETNDIALAPGATRSVTANVFFGPRKREILKNPYYSGVGVGYEHTLETSGSCAFCTFQWLVDFLMQLLGMFQWVLRDWGLAIIALVFVVRTLLHPITKRAQVNMAKMGKMGPEIERIKKKFGDDKEGLNRAMLEFYKTQGATPVLGCLPMFLQMPIWIALYSGLSSTFELRQAPFLHPFGHSLTWIHDLSKPDHLIQFSQPFNFMILHIDGLNVIPILLAGAFFLQQKFTPKPPATTPEQVQQQKMMQWMTLLFPVFLYSSPSGLNLYILTSTIFGIIEGRIIRKHIKEREALVVTGPTFVDGEIIDRQLSKKEEPKKTGGVMSWFTKLQNRAEQIRNDAEKKAREKRR